MLQVKVLSIKKNYMNVILPENGLFGYIKLPGNKETEEWEEQYPKGTTIKAIIIGFPFDERSYREQSENEQELLKIEMALDYPPPSSEDIKDNFPIIVKEIHPLIDLDKERF